MYVGNHTQTMGATWPCETPGEVAEICERFGWEDSEWELFVHNKGVEYPAEFPCVYSFHYGEEHYTCELTSNRPDSLCPFHAGEED